MTDVETYLTELDRVLLRWQPREEQQRRLSAELTLCSASCAPTRQALRMRSSAG